MCRERKKIRAVERQVGIKKLQPLLNRTWSHALIALQKDVGRYSLPRPLPTKNTHAAEASIGSTLSISDIPVFTNEKTAGRSWVVRQRE